MSETAELAGLALAAFERFRGEFAAITAHAGGRFARRDWQGIQRDAVERLGVYGAVLHDLVADCRALLGALFRDESVWRAAKRAYTLLVASRGDVEIAETFFNSLTRRVFSTVGVDPEIEFVASEAAAAVDTAPAPPLDTYPWPAADPASLMRAILAGCPLTVPFADLDRDAREGGALLAEQLRAAGVAPGGPVEVLRAPFYRNRRAYLVGRINDGERVLPLLLPLAHGSDGVRLDAVLTVEDEVSIVFSFARSYFHVASERPRELAAFLHTIMPRKPVAELYTSIGHHKHGKTELYRALLRHLERSDDRFEIAPGERGLVMIVFTLPAWDVVFKVIRDVPAPPKQVTRREVLERYRLVFTHDRVGRLVDAQEFEHLSFDRRRFAPELLAELAAHAPASVGIGPDTVTISHLFTERRVTPLNLYLAAATPEQAQDAVIDLGHAIKDLAAANIFPGDVLLKNFGVTRHGRVVFYDYDELCLLETCMFRDLPEPREPAEELADEPWFSVGEHDIFPAELLRFLGLPPELRVAYLARHADLYGVAFWRDVQARCARGEPLDVASYRPERRLSPSRPPR